MYTGGGWDVWAMCKRKVEKTETDEVPRRRETQGCRMDDNEPIPGS